MAGATAPIWIVVALASERFVGTLKTELVADWVWRSRCRLELSVVRIRLLVQPRASARGSPWGIVEAHSGSLRALRLTATPARPGLGPTEGAVRNCPWAPVCLIVRSMRSYASAFRVRSDPPPPLR